MNPDKARPDDIPAIITMKCAMFAEAGVAMGASEAQLITLYQNYYRENVAFHYLIRHQGEPVAMAGGFVKNDFPFCLYPNPAYGFIGDVYVQADYRRQGFAGTLSSAVIERFKSMDIDTIRLLASHDARGLYEKLGFTQADMMELDI